MGIKTLLHGVCGSPTHLLCKTGNTFQPHITSRKQSRRKWPINGTQKGEVRKHEAQNRTKSYHEKYDHDHYPSLSVWHDRCCGRQRKILPHNRLKLSLNHTIANPPSQRVFFMAVCACPGNAARVASYAFFWAYTLRCARTPIRTPL